MRKVLSVPAVGTKVYIVERKQRRTYGYNAEVTKVTKSGQFVTAIKFGTPEKPDPRADMTHRWFEPTYGTQFRIHGEGPYSMDDWSIYISDEAQAAERIKVERERARYLAIHSTFSIANNLSRTAEAPKYYNRLMTPEEVDEMEQGCAKLIEALKLQKHEAAIVDAERKAAKEAAERRD